MLGISSSGLLLGPLFELMSPFILCIQIHALHILARTDNLFNLSSFGRHVPVSHYTCICSTLIVWPFGHLLLKCLFCYPIDHLNILFYKRFVCLCQFLKLFHLSLKKTVLFSSVQSLSHFWLIVTP